MILYITEQQKQVIENYGYKVIDFKAWAYKLERVVLDTIDKIWSAIILFVQRAVERFQECVDRMSIAFEEMKEYFDEADFMENDNHRMQYAIVKSLGQKYEPRYSNIQYRRKCRDRC